MRKILLASIVTLLASSAFANENMSAVDPSTNNQDIQAEGEGSTGLPPEFSGMSESERVIWRWTCHSRDWWGRGYWGASMTLWGAKWWALSTCNRMTHVGGCRLTYCHRNW